MNRVDIRTRSVNSIFSQWCTSDFNILKAVENVTLPMSQNLRQEIIVATQERLYEQS